MKETIGTIAALLCASFAFWVYVTEHLPDPAPTESCSCAGRAECVTRVAQVTEHSRAYCALWIEEDERRDACCLVVDSR